MKVVRLTTVDNPWDPIDHWDEWLKFDTSILNENTLGVLGRELALYPEPLTDEEAFMQKEEAIDKIIKFDPFNKYRKVLKEVKDEEFES